LHDNKARADINGLHELATNAAKYGALSVTKGCVEVKWAVSNDQVILNWIEKGGPPVNEPTRQGFGTRVMKRIVKYQHKGDIRPDWSAEGLSCEIILPM
jgi:two-component sensor histidine kinase